MPVLNLLNFESGTSKALSRFDGHNVIGNIDLTFGMMVSAAIKEPLYTLMLLADLAGAFVIEQLAVNSRSKYKGSRAAIAGVAIPIGYLVIGTLQPISVNYVYPILSFAIAPIGLGILELYNVKVVKALDVKKQDTRMKFGEAFEDLQQGNVTETFDDIGNYENTKSELKDAIIAPIERKGISRAYNIKPLKSGNCMYIALSILPGLSSAGSSLSGTFVAPTTITCSSFWKPSSSCKSCESMCLWTSSVSKSLLMARESISSMKRTQGVFLFATLNMLLSTFSDSPVYADTMLVPFI